MYRITIEETNQVMEIVRETTVEPAMKTSVKLYEQSVETLDLRRVIDAINYKPRTYSKRKERSPA